MTILEQQLNRFFEVLNASKLPSDLTDALSLTIGHYFVAQSGTSDAVKVSIPVLRGMKGSYNASTNSPILTNGSGIEGDSYLVSTGATRDFGNGNIQLSANEVVEYREGQWRKRGGGSATSSIEFYSVWAEKPAVGTANILYVDLENTLLYRWDDTSGAYIPFSEEITVEAIETALGYTPANDSEVVKTIETAEGAVLEMDESGKVILPDFSTSGGGVATVETATWNTGDDFSFSVTDSSKIIDVYLNGNRVQDTLWDTPTATSILVDASLFAEVTTAQYLTFRGSSEIAPSSGGLTPQQEQDLADSKKDVISYALSSPSADLAAGDTDSFVAPYDFTLNSYFAGVAVAPSGSALVVGLKKNGTSVTISDAIIDSGETTSLTGTAPVITTTSFSKGDLITPAIVQVGSLDTGKSLKIYLEITKTL